MRMTDKQYKESKCNKCGHKIKVNDQVIYCPFVRCIYAKKTKEDM